MIHRSKLVLLATVLSFGMPNIAYPLDLGLDDIVEELGGNVDDKDVDDTLEIDITDVVEEVVDHVEDSIDDVLEGDAEALLDRVDEVVADVEINNDGGLGVGLGGDTSDDVKLTGRGDSGLPGLPGLPGGGNGGNGGNGGPVIVNVPTTNIIRGGVGAGGGGGGGASAYQQLLARFNAMTTAQRAQLITQCLAVLASPRRYAPDQVQTCQMVAQIPGIMGYLSIATR